MEERLGEGGAGRVGERKKDGEMKKEQSFRETETDRLRRKKRQQCTEKTDRLRRRERHTDPDRDKSRCRGTRRRKDIEPQGLLRPLPPHHIAPGWCQRATLCPAVVPTWPLGKPQSHSLCLRFPYWSTGTLAGGPTPGWRWR